jgi:hypothetical protein
MLSVQVAVDSAQLGAKDPPERHRGHLHHRHLGAELTGRGSDLAPDPSATDDHHGCGSLDRLL